MIRNIALTALTALRLSGVPVHEPVHGRGAYIPRPATVRNAAKSAWSTSARAPREIGRALLGDQAQLSRPGDGLRTVGRTKLVQDMADMFFDGVDGNDKLPGDSLV